MQLITDINPNATSSNAIKETLIRADISKLCSFFSRQKTSEFLLPHMITILNEKTDWSVRAAFFDALCPVLTCIGWESVEIVKSLLEQGLRDSEEFVIHRTLNTLSKMVEIGLLDRQQIFYFLKNHITALLCHPSLWIRHGAVNFVTMVCKQKVNVTSAIRDR
jgi:phosphoinositide-3-kinase regulatory subunit 4